MIEALAFIPIVGQAVNFFNSVKEWNKYKVDRIIPKIMAIAKPENIDEDSQVKIAYALKKVFQDTNTRISEYASVKRKEFKKFIYDKYNECSVLDDAPTEIKDYIKEIINVILDNIDMIETVESYSKTALKNTAAHQDEINELREKVHTYGKDIEQLKELHSHVGENSDNAVLDNQETNEECSPDDTSTVDDKKSDNKEPPKTKKLKPGLLIAILGIITGLGIVMYFAQSDSNNPKTNNKTNILTTTISKVSTTTEPIITTETVTAIQKETETRSTVSQTSTTISNNPNNEITITENTSLEQTTLPPIETTTVVTEPPSHSNEESKFICEEYHINAIEDFCEDMSGVIITEYEGNPPEQLIIPAQIDDKQVIAIGKDVFSGKDSIKSLVIPDTVYEIQERAFRNCSYLSNIYLGKNVLIIGDYAFFCDQFYSNEERILKVSNPKFEDDEERAFHGKQWNGRNDDDYRIAY